MCGTSKSTRSSSQIEDTGRWFAVEDVAVGSRGRNLAKDSIEGREGNGDDDCL